MDKRLLLLPLILLLLVPTVHAQSELTILRDESHGQYYKSDSFSVLISSLQDAGVNVKTVSSGFLDAVKNADPKNTIIVIPNPEEGNFTSDEIEALKAFVESGGVLILMSDVQYQTSSGPRKYGKPGTLNAIIFAMDPNAKVYFEGTDDNGNEIYDDVNNAGRPRQIKVSSDLLAPVIRSGIEGDIVATTSMVHAEDPSYVLAFTSSTAYAKAVDGTIIAKGNIPRLAYFDYGEGRVILSGTTRTFTDTMISLSPDNKVLFVNIISRASGVTLSIEALKTTLPIVDIVVIRLAMTAVVFYDARYMSMELERRERIRIALNASVKYVFVIAVLIAIFAAIQAAMMKAIFITTAYPGRSQPSSLENVPMWANAAARYFFAALVDGIIGIFLGLIALRIEKVRELIVRYRKALKVL